MPCSTGRARLRKVHSVRRLAIVVLALLLIAACTKASKGYSGDTEGAFLQSCTHNEAQPAPVCKCIYDEITRKIPFDSYVEIDKQMQKDDSFVPDELEQIYTVCDSRLRNVTSTTASTTTTSTSTTSTTSTSSTTTSTTIASTTSSSQN
jgi:hypothetical protein